MSKVYLKIKIKSLADEAKIIRHEERIYKTKGYEALTQLRKLDSEGGDATEDALVLLGRTNKNYKLFNGLKEHREGIVRSETRAALIAYGFLRGKPYQAIENSTAGLQLLSQCYDQSWSANTLWDRVGRLIAKYGPPDKLAHWGTQKKQGAEKLLFDTLKKWVGGEPVNH
jgi:hypothetical protein